MKYGFGVEGLNWIAVVHGWVYFVYLLFTANLAVKVRWPIAKTIGVLLAGTIPLVGIIVEQIQTRDIKEKLRFSSRSGQVLEHLFGQLARRDPPAGSATRPRSSPAPSRSGIRSQKACPALGYGKIGS